jgi:hypothetical protein
MSFWDRQVELEQSSARAVAACEVELADLPAGQDALFVE